MIQREVDMLLGLLSKRVMEKKMANESIAHRLLDGLERISVVLRAGHWAVAVDAKLNLAQGQVLRLLANRRDGLRPKDIAAYLGVSAPSIADTISALVRKGLVTREADPADARSALVQATKEGLRIGFAVRRAETQVAAALEALSLEASEQLLQTQIALIRNLQLAGAIPMQRMCPSCRYFRTNAHPGASKIHHCAFVDAAIGNRDLRLDCGDHEVADPAIQAATWAAFAMGASTLQAQP
jgi:DNA-binding MarR family transcriptional regulator